MRSLALVSLTALLMLVAGCDTIADPPVIDDPPAALLPFGEGNFWVLERLYLQSGNTERDTLASVENFELAGEVWAQITGTSSLVECAAAFFTRRDDGYYFTHTDPRISTEDVRLKYAYPAEVGSQYVIEPSTAAVSGEASWAPGTITVTVVATDEPIDTPWGMKTAYRYRFDIETFFNLGEEHPVTDAYYYRVLVPDLGFVEFDVGFLTIDPDTGDYTGRRLIEWTLLDAYIQPEPVP